MGNSLSSRNLRAQLDDEGDRVIELKDEETGEPVAKECDCEKCAKTREAGGECDAPAVQRVAELADHHERVAWGFSHDAYSIGRKRLVGCLQTVHDRPAYTCVPLEPCTELIDRATRGAMVVVHCAVRHLVFENVFFHPAVCLLFDVNQFRRFHDALQSIRPCFSHYCARTERFSQQRSMRFSR